PTLQTRRRLGQLVPTSLPIACLILRLLQPAPQRRTRGSDRRGSLLQRGVLQQSQHDLVGFGPAGRAGPILVRVVCHPFSPLRHACLPLIRKLIELAPYNSVPYCNMICSVLQYDRIGFTGPSFAVHRHSFALKDSVTICLPVPPTGGMNVVTTESPCPK